MRVTRIIFVALLACLAGAPAAHAQGVIEYYETDAIGSVRAVTDAAGTVIARHDYFPFGEEFAPPAPSGAPVRFAGKERDTETGLDYFGARHYASRLGRFTTVDPEVAWRAARDNPQLWNRYAYGLNNPLRFVDPDGRCVWDICAVEGMTAYVVGAAAVAQTAWLVSPPGRQAVSDVSSQTGAMITTGVGAIGSWFHSEKRPGTLGKPDHQATAAEEAARIGGEREERINTSGGKKGYRRADVVKWVNGAIDTIIQIYRPTPAGNIPRREVDAATDIEKATGVKPQMVPVRSLP